ncbi:MAG: PIN domain-containing protein [Thaumarchaeota archaeon]|nr:PIN domain-containing protein [Nitrososphaerota archaeon]
MKGNAVAFVDTNILAYAFDESDENRRQPCVDLVRAGFQGEAEYSISNQVLSELFVVLTKQVGKPLPKEKAAIVVSGFADSSKWKKLNYTHITVKRALQDLQTISTSFWDILIAETMREAGIKLVYTENEKDFRKIPWVQTKNPLPT